MKWETMFSPDLTWKTISLSHHKGRLEKFLVFNSSKWRILHRTKALLASAIIADSQDIGKEIVINVSSLGTFSL